jgi:hypothetical protein
MTGKDKNNNSGRKRKGSINDLNEHDRKLYQEIMESIIKEKGIKPSDIQEEIKKRKKEGKSFSNHKQVCKILNINRTSIYTDYVRKEKIIISPIKKHFVKGLIEWMCIKIIESDYTVGRDKLYQTYCKTKGYSVSTYVFRVHFEAMEYKSRAYIRKGANPPIEKKYKGIYCKDKVNFKYNSSFLHEK